MALLMTSKNLQQGLFFADMQALAKQLLQQR